MTPPQQTNQFGFLVSDFLFFHMLKYVFFSPVKNNEADSESARMLHAQVATLPDRELFRLGELSFKEQFTTMGRPGPQEMDALKTRPFSIGVGVVVVDPKVF